MTGATAGVAFLATSAFALLSFMVVQDGKVDVSRNRASTKSPQQVRQEAIAQRTKTLDALVTQIKTTEVRTFQDRTRVVSAIRTLGDLKAIENCQVLFEHLDFHESGGVSDNDGEPDPFEKQYPAIYALVQIGASAVPPLLEYVSRTDLSKTAEAMAARAIRYIGHATKTPGAIRSMLDEYARQLKNKNGKARIAALAQAYDERFKE